MKKLLLIPLVVVLVSGLILGGCAPAPAPAAPRTPQVGPTPAPIPGPAPTPALVPAPPKPAAKPAPAKPGVIKLRYASVQPPAGWAWQKTDGPWLDQVEEATGGKVKFERYPAQTLAKFPDMWEACKSGIADLTWNFHGMWPGMTSLSDVTALPFMPFKSSEQASAILWKLYEEFPNLAKQYKANKVLLTWMTEPYYLITTKKQIKTMEDLKGMKLRIIGGPPTEVFREMGAVPMMIPMTDNYISMQKGVTDGMGSVWEATYSFRLYEVVKYYTYAPLYMGYFTVAANWNSWNKLPPDIQKAIESVSGLKGSKFWGRTMFDDIKPIGRDLVKEKGYEMIEYDLPKEELARWQEVAAPFYEKWVKDMEAQGYPEAQQILDRTRELIETYTP